MTLSPAPHSAAQPDWRNLTYSVTPSLLAWTGVLLHSPLGYVCFIYPPPPYIPPSQYIPTVQTIRVCVLHIYPKYVVPTVQTIRVSCVLHISQVCCTYCTDRLCTGLCYKLLICPAIDGPIFLISCNCNVRVCTSTTVQPLHT